MTRHRSGSPQSWKARRLEYEKRSGPVSDPEDGRPRAKDRRYAKRAPHRAKLRDWAEALEMDATLTLRLP